MQAHDLQIIYSEYLAIKIFRKFDYPLGVTANIVVYIALELQIYYVFLQFVQFVRNKLWHLIFYYLDGNLEDRANYYNYVTT